MFETLMNALHEKLIEVLVNNNCGGDFRAMYHNTQTSRQDHL